MSGRASRTASAWCRSRPAAPVVGRALVRLNCGNFRSCQFTHHGARLLVPQELARPMVRVAPARPVQVVQAVPPLFVAADEGCSLKGQETSCLKSAARGCDTHRRQ